MIRTSTKYLLLLSFLLACLPAQTTHRHEIVKTKAFVVVVDHVQSLAAAEGAQKADKETEDPHPLIFCDFSLPDAPAEKIPHFSSSILANITAYYPIRAPPAQA
ncbi:MAG TPA: hypothetical protein VLE50_02095 [Cellvibrio sp.]|nr:hypothetical protein [Cellvibrio sp.]